MLLDKATGKRIPNHNIWCPKCYGLNSWDGQSLWLICPSSKPPSSCPVPHRSQGRAGYVLEIPPPSRLPSQVLCPGSSWLVPWQRELHGSLLSSPHTQEETEGQQRLLQLHEEGGSWGAAAKTVSRWGKNCTSPAIGNPLARQKKWWAVFLELCYTR